MSVVADDAEWQTRRISVFGAVKSFIGQLTVGQDLVRVSLPSAFVYPYSGLELGGLRALETYEILQKANEIEDPVRRLLQVIAYYVSKTRKEQFEKKPSNPILGENHYCWIEGKNGPVRYFAEQVSHHPPVSAYIFESKGDQIVDSLNFESAGIKFYGNSVGVSIVRPERLELRKFNEIYEISKPFPDLMIRNVILGTKRETWEGDVVFSCKQTGLRATLNYKEEGWYCTNVFNGTVYHSTTDGASDVPIVKVTGAVSDTFKAVPLSSSEASSSKSDLRKSFTKEEVIVDYNTIKRSKLEYLPEDEWDERSSLRVWRDMFKAIIVDDLAKADEAKKSVEDAQRERRKQDKNYKPLFFAWNESEDRWNYKFDTLENLFERKKELEKEETVESTPSETTEEEST